MSGAALGERPVLPPVRHAPAGGQRTPAIPRCGLHGLHVVIGAIVIATMTRFTAKGVITPDNYVKLEAAGLYWHLVDIIWIFLFPLFYLIT